ncbi:MAG: DUF1844 domain-containing protein [Acidobacteria bacterium]|nr:DUF1844 domain-containing protein [Acidobacteriota bacterium]
MSKGDKEIKITDKRMFTPDGELREEYRFLAEKSTAAAPEAAAAPSPAPAPSRAEQAVSGVAAQPTPERTRAASQEGGPSPGGGSAPASGRSAGTGARGRGEPPPVEPYGPDAAGDSGARLEIPGSPPGLGPSFYDLAAMLAEPVAVYLGEVELTDGESAENLEMARLYIDLLDVLRQKTAGNLTAQESAFLEDLLYRLRVRYFQKRG